MGDINALVKDGLNAALAAVEARGSWADVKAKTTRLTDAIVASPSASATQKTMAKQLKATLTGSPTPRLNSIKGLEAARATAMNRGTRKMSKPLNSVHVNSGKANSVLVNSGKANSVLVNRRSANSAVVAPPTKNVGKTREDEAVDIFKHLKYTLGLPDEEIKRQIKKSVNANGLPVYTYSGDALTYRNVMSGTNLSI
jgi:hypothetical protein